VTTGLVFGAVPGYWIGGRVRLSGLEAGPATGTVRSRRLQRLLVVGQVAVAYTVVVLAGLALRTAWQLGRTELGYETTSVASFEVGLDQDRYRSTEAAGALFAAVTERLETLEEVDRAVRVMGGPLSDHQHRDAFFLEQPDGRSEPVTALSRVVDPGAFEVLDVEVVLGRSLEAGDAPGAPLVAVVNRTFHDRYMAGRFALGTSMTRCHGPDDCPETMRVVGVVDDVRWDGPDVEVPPEVYQVGRQLAWGGEHVLLRLQGDPRALERELVAVVHAVDPDLAVSGYATLDALRREHTRRWRFFALLVGALAALAAGLAVTGIFGVASLSAAARTRELGIRRAFGAAPAGLGRLVLSEGLGVTLVGLVLGFGLLVGLQRAFADFLEPFLRWTPPFDPPTLAGTALLFLTVGALAAWRPAERAASVDVMRVLSEP
jgi:predicted permease